MITSELNHSPPRTAAFTKTSLVTFILLSLLSTFRTVFVIDGAGRISPGAKNDRLRCINADNLLYFRLEKYAKNKRVFVMRQLVVFFFYDEILRSPYKDLTRFYEMKNELLTNRSTTNVSGFLN